ncbi:MAG: hypothetical protein Aureis2KO_01700 [Aureisphaera sp.]
MESKDSEEVPSNLQSKIVSKSSGVTVIQTPHPIYDNEIQYSIGPNADIGENDLVVWIMPNGHQRTGHTISQVYSPGSELNTGQVFFVEKGKWGLVDLGEQFEANDIPLHGNFNTDITSPIVDFEGLNIKAESTWNLVPNNWTFVMLSFTNTLGIDIPSGSINLRAPYYPDNILAFDNQKSIIPNNWASFFEYNLDKPGIQEITWTYNDLAPGEVRTIYAYFSLGNESTDDFDYLDGIDAVIPFYVSHDGQESSLVLRKTNPPHDPNRLDLLNVADLDPKSGEYTFPEYNTPYFDASVWTKELSVLGTDYLNLPPDTEKPAFYQMAFPKEQNLLYRLSFENDGAGKARDMIVSLPFLVLPEYDFDLSSLEIIGAEHYDPNDIQIQHTEKDIQFLLPDIFLYGKQDPYTTRKSTEVKGYVDFKIGVNNTAPKPIVSNATITLYEGCTTVDANQHYCYAVDPIQTNDVIVFSLGVDEIK